MLLEAVVFIHPTKITDIDNINIVNIINFFMVSPPNIRIPQKPQKKY